MKVCVITLGCKVNQCESGGILRELGSLGYETAEKECAADVFIVNTCAVTNEAESKSRQTVNRLHRKYPNAKIVVCGCSSQNKPEKFYADDRLIIGTTGKGKLVGELMENGVLIVPIDNCYEELPFSQNERTRSYIKVQDGCNNFCSYCLIPYLRGRSRSRSIESILAETSAKSHIKEFVITGIDISSFEGGLSLLMQQLASDKFRVRLGSLEVGVICKQFLETLVDMPNFCPHFHLSLQSGSSSVLKKMNRHYTANMYADSVDLIRKYFPHCAITTDIIVGFPTETESQHAESLAFCQQIAFSDIHVFCYSLREGTVAAKLEQVDAGIKKQRLSEFMALKQRLKDNYIQSNIGNMASVVIEESNDGIASGYTENYLRAYISDSSASCGDIVVGEISSPSRDGVIIVI